MYSKMKKWVGYPFSSGSYPGKDYVTFQREARAELNKFANSVGFSLHMFLKGHYEFSAVLKHTESGKFVYVSIPDVRFSSNQWFESVLYRTMAHDKDWSGGLNQRCRWDELPEKLHAMANRKTRQRRDKSGSANRPRIGGDSKSTCALHFPHS